MRNRETIIDQIKALLSKTAANGCTEAEELAALAKAAAMRDAWVITNEELALSKEEAAVLHSDPPDLADPHGIKWKMAYSISQFCGVQMYRSRGETGLKAIGLKSDVQLAMWLLDHLADFVHHQLMVYLITDCAPRGERRTTMRSFVEGVTGRLSERLRELAEHSETTQTSNGRELVVVKETAIKEFMKQNGVRLRCNRVSHSPKNVNEAAREAGRAAGDRASFGRPVTDAGGPLRIGGGI
jgi:hypothetical protein